MSVALALAVELLRFPVESFRAKQWLDALTHVAGDGLRTTQAYHGHADVLAIWGPGDPERAEIIAKHVALGGRVLAFDLAYWDRDRKVRVSIDAAHPQASIMRGTWPTTRWTADRVTVADRWNQTGPVIVAGIGRKARVQYGDQAVASWEAQMIDACRRRWPARQVRYRRKQQDAPLPSGVALTSDHPIEQVLAGASLVVTWHSNVAVDAIRLGIPVICRDGAAAAVCPTELAGYDPRPLEPAVRDRFLANLAWFQWAPREAADFWRWVPEALS